MPAGHSHSRGGGLPWRGSSVIVLETKAANGNRSSSASPKARRAAIASNVPEPLTTGARARCRRTRVSSVVRVEHRAVDAQAHVAAVGRRRRSRSRRRSRRPCPTRARAAPARALARTARARPRASPAARRRRPRRARRCRARRQQLGDEAVVADRAVVGRDPRAGSSAAPAACAASRKPSSVSRRGAERVLPDRQRRDADAAADEQRPAPVARRREAVAERAEQPAARRRRRARTAARCRADVLEQEVERAVARRAARRTRAAGTGARPRRRPSARPRRACRTGPVRARPVGSAT